jgi:hypothetical protein
VGDSAGGLDDPSAHGRASADLCTVITLRRLILANFPPGPEREKRLEWLARAVSSRREALRVTRGASSIMTRAGTGSGRVCRATTSLDSVMIDGVRPEREWQPAGRRYLDNVPRQPAARLGCWAALEGALPAAAHRKRPECTPLHCTTSVSVPSGAELRVRGAGCPA